MALFLRLTFAASIGVASLVSTLSGQEPSAVQWIKDRTYSEIAGQNLQLDVALPSVSAPGRPLPAVVYFHGGGWQAGKRQDAYEQLRFLASKGFVGITVSYRFAPEFKWPAQSTMPRPRCASCARTPPNSTSIRIESPLPGTRPEATSH